MTVVAPSRRSLSRRSNRIYTAGRAGSGFVANVTIMPTNVSFRRIQVQEGTVSAVATGYYNTVLGWSGLTHPAGNWLTPNARNRGIIDTIGTNPPGTLGPFSPGSFVWAIPQLYRAGTSGTPHTYSTGRHTQTMLGSTGRETTSKEGASRSRSP
jgi:hypothetical protein